jgi:hypothetical protein
MRSIGATLLSFTLFAVSGSSAYACSCANPSQREKFRKADCVFLGEVIGITDSNVEGFIWAAKFKVEKLWKGPKIPEPIVNFTFDTPGWCGDLSLAKEISDLCLSSEGGSCQLYRLRSQSAGEVCDIQRQEARPPLVSPVRACVSLLRRTAGASQDWRSREVAYV